MTAVFRVSFAADARFRLSVRGSTPEQLARATAEQCFAEAGKLRCVAVSTPGRGVCVCVEGWVASRHSSGALTQDRCPHAQGWVPLGPGV